ncbi:helix-turn-helix domain-containing protein [Parasphaerochaeta coccoides]|uniref:Helix-turn-helix domain-containing protein n=1 Tax=Parasphaerochaeta coccoides (strain ATCC BAA-1237 / DSM 17374 / SPN1) TaxID=760011 RepID=F4GHC5_PARC1|nr:helix-turn-helix domain-containing protein [Parasphaerochaeta coccoides]AEC02024.1 hypothetical protein Spico_0799 [Parasphaerochaeta coccoides DSM 17374]
MKPFYTVADVAEILGTSKVNVTEMLKRTGKEKVSGVYLISPDELAYLKERRGKVGRPKGQKNKKSEE